MTPHERNELFHKWRPLSLSLAKKAWQRCPGKWGSLADARQEAAIGLLNGLRLYNPTHPSDATLMTYLYTAISRWLQRRQAENNIIKIPANLVFDALKEPSPCEHEYVASARRALHVRQFPMFCRSRDNSSFEPPDKEMTPADMDELNDIINRLRPRWRFVIIHSYGLQGERPKSYREIAESLGVTRERIRQLKEAAMEHLRKHHKHQLTEMLA